MAFPRLVHGRLSSTVLFLYVDKLTYILCLSNQNEDTVVELNVPFNNNSHTVLKGALLTGAVPLIF